MIVYKIIGLMMILAALAFNTGSWLREYLNEKQKRRNRRFARKCRNTYKESFRTGTLKDIEQWRGENKPKKQNKNPELAEVIGV